MPQPAKSADKSEPKATGKPLHHKILSLAVTGGFLDGFKVDFADGLNCIIGGRGTGKTTVLEFLRYGLNAMPARGRSDGQYEQIEKLLKGNLGTGRIKITVETKEGLKYVVEREVDGDIAVFDEQGEPIEVWPGAVVDAEVYSQNQIEEIANNPHFQLNLIDKFVKDEVAGIGDRLRIVGRDLDHNAVIISRLEQESRELSGGQTEVKLLQEKLKTLQPVKGEVAEVLQAEVSKRAVRDKEKRLLERLSGYLGQVANELDGVRTPFEEKVKSGLQYLDSEFVGQDNSALLKKLRQGLAGCVGDAKIGMINAASALRGFEGTLADSTKELERLHRQQEQKYQEILKKHEAERGQAQEQTQLQKKLNELQEKKRELDEKNKSLKAKKDEREALLKKLSELRDERWDCRQSVAAKLNAHLGPVIRIQIERCGDRRAYKKLLTECLKGTGGKWYTSLASKIGDEIAPAEFAELVHNKDVQELVDQLSIEPDKAEWLIEQLCGAERIFRIQTAEVDDKPSIQLEDGEYKDSTALSIGQKCTTILPILLWGSTSPLIVDQPEDNLDNYFIYETVVKRIETVQRERQIIFVTHNPNIPVLGEASRVLAMRSDGQRGYLDKCGTVDQVKTFIETFLEGGREAFVGRKKKYGIK